MLFGPVFSFDLVTSARRWQTFLVRSGYGAVLLLALWMRQSAVYWNPGPATLKQTADAMAAFFAAFAAVQLLAVLILCPAQVAGTIARERERRTIEYLFASPLRNTEIVLGKLGAGLMRTIYVLLVGQGILALGSLLGGIPPDRQLLVMLLTLTTLLAAAGVSIVASVWTPKARIALGRAYSWLFLLVAVPWLIWMMTSALSIAGMGTAGRIVGRIIDANHLLLSMNPFTGLMVALDVRRAGGSAALEVIGPMAAGHCMVAIVCVALAVTQVRRVHLRSSGAAARQNGWLTLGWRRRLTHRPMLWKELHVEQSKIFADWRGRLLLSAGYLLVAAAIGVGFYRTVAVYGSGEPVLAYTIPVGVCTALLGLVWIASRAAVAITSERERDTWTTLLSSPLLPKEIVQAKLLGSLYAGRWIAVLLLALWLATALVRPPFWVPLAASLATTAILAWFFAALGLRFSLSAKSSTSALVGTLGTGFVIGGGYLFFGMPCLIGLAPGDSFPYALMIAPCIPFLLAFPGFMTEVLGSSGPDAEMVVGYVLGLGGYFFAALVLSVTSWDRFDELASRMRTIDRPSIDHATPLTAAPQTKLDGS